MDGNRNKHSMTGKHNKETDQLTNTHMEMNTQSMADRPTKEQTDMEMDRRLTNTARRTDRETNTAWTDVKTG